MAIRKNKQDIKGDNILKDNMFDYDMSYYYMWGDYDDYYHDCDCDVCSSPWRWRESCQYAGDYRYEEGGEVYLDHVQKKYYRSTRYKNIFMRKIDMNSIYSKEMLRDKKINQLLGLEYDSYYKPTLGDVFPKKLKIDEN